jgi:glycosyltransferase involved in cell wall biosynthesis
MISVMIGAYNAEEFIAEAIESVLRQSYQDFELIVVDDGSTDQTRRVIESFSTFGVQYRFQSNKGAAAARNHCIRLARGEYLAFLDADDVWTENKLELQMNEFAKDPSLDAVFGMVQQVLQNDWGQKIQEAIIPDSELLKGYTQATMLIKRESFLRIGLFTEARAIGEFVDWLLRAKESNLKMRLLPNLFLRRRIHNNNLGIRKRAEINDYLKVLKESIDRRRITQTDKKS